MTAIVGIRCQDGVVIGSDSSATFGDGGGRNTIEQSTAKKIEIIGDCVIVAGTGAVGHMQRFSAVIQNLWDQKAFQGKTEIEIGKMLSSGGITTKGPPQSAADCHDPQEAARNDQHFWRPLASRYPEVAYAIENPSSPVVLELCGISRDRLLGEKGSSDIDAVKTFDEMQAYPEISFPSAYRILDVTPADIIAVHDLSDWPNEEDHDSSWRPDPSRVAEVRRSPQEWLAKEAALNWAHCR